MACTALDGVHSVGNYGADPTDPQQFQSPVFIGTHEFAGQIFVLGKLGEYRGKPGRQRIGVNSDGNRNGLFGSNLGRKLGAEQRHLARIAQYSGSLIGGNDRTAAYQQDGTKAVLQSLDPLTDR
ncbi:hypothetical protein [Glutamicibacter arilaitensis]|uniref:hypothetical protein n=1 Tax=Glutamicibacter arilaitensis TaxID=256701 RepID=UPI0021F805E6|nr:hypothetical protein [Glutamicibacter arilaitensis]